MSANPVTSPSPELPEGIGEDTMASFNPNQAMMRDMVAELDRISSSSATYHRPGEWDLGAHLDESQALTHPSAQSTEQDSMFRPRTEAEPRRMPDVHAGESMLGATVQPLDSGSQPAVADGASRGADRPASVFMQTKGLFESDTHPRPSAGVGESPPEPQRTRPSATTDGGAASQQAKTTPNPYELVRVIGEGGFGEVWEAKQTNLRRSVAIKRLKLEDRKRKPIDENTKAIMVESFHCEAFTTATLDHPNIVPIHDLGVDDQGRPIIAMKLVRGTPWNKMLQDDWALLSEHDYLAKHLAILIQIGQAVAFAHSRGLIHRDIKPSQVMVGEFDEVLLMDWGLSVAVDEEALRTHRDAFIPTIAPSLVTASNPAGTVAYMAPEQTLQAANQLGPWTDVYLLGATLYNVLTGKTPHQGKMATAYSQAAGGFIVPFEESAPDRHIPKELADLAIEAMVPDLRERNLSARTFVQRLKDFLTGASNRAQSVELAAGIRRMLEEGKGRLSYQRYTDAISRLRQAQALWRDNPEIPALEETLCGGFAEAAIETGDLSLAQILIMQMPRGSKRDELDARAAARIRLIAAQRLRRRATMAALVVLSVVAIAGLLLHNRSLAGRLRQATSAAAVTP